jgi:hypothetical protein
LLLLEYCGGGELFRLAAVQQDHRLAEQCAPTPASSHHIRMAFIDAIIVEIPTLSPQIRPVLHLRSASCYHVLAQYRLHLSRPQARKYFDI